MRVGQYALSICVCVSGDCGKTVIIMVKIDALLSPIFLVGS